MAELAEAQEKWSSALAGRRLFSFGMPDVGGLVGSASQWVESSAASVVNKVMDVTEVSKLFSNASTWVQQGLAVAMAALTSMTDLATKMYSIFVDFKPLKPIFESANGLMELVMQPEKTGQLVHVVRELLNTSTVLQRLNEALHQVSGMFVELSSFFHNLLNRLGMGGGGRRLSGSWTSLLEGIDFNGIVKALTGYLGPLGESTATLLSVAEVLGPMLAKLDEHFGKTGTSRRLEGGMEESVKEVLNLQANQEKYAGAIAKVIPTWQAVEKLGVDMCPTVALSQSSAYSLKCRVASFVHNSVGLSLNSIPGMVSGCGGEPDAQASKAAEDAKCPNTAYSAGLKNVLGENSSSLGWILAGVGLLTAGGGIFAVLRKRCSGDEESESGDEAEDGARLVEGGAE